MKKPSYFWILTVLLFVLLLSACGQMPGESGKLRVVASVYPIYDLAAKVGGDKIDLVNLLPAGAEAHHWEPTPKDVAALQDADVFLYNGVGMEHWVADILAGVETDLLLVVETAKDALLLPWVGAADDHDHGGYDPHTWLSPLNAKRQMESIKNALAQADPDNAAYYQQNYDAYAARLDELDGAFQAALAGVSRRDVVVTHRAFGYLCGAYGLTQVGIEGVSHDSEPSPDQLKKTIQFIKQNGVTTVFYHAADSTALADLVAAEAGVQTAALSTMENLTAEQQREGADYFSVMRQNLAALKAALQ